VSFRNIPMSFEIEAEWSISKILSSSAFARIGIFKLSAYLATFVSGQVELVRFLCPLLIMFTSLSSPDLDVVGDETMLWNVKLFAI